MTVALVFVIFQILPSGDPATLRAGRFASPEQIEVIRSQMGLDQPGYVQFGIFLRDLVLHFDLGTSLRYDEPVTELIFARLPVTLLLIFGAALVWFVAGILAGVASGARRGSLADRAQGGLSLFFVSAPVFWTGYMAMFLLAAGVGQISLLPGVGGWGQADGWSGQLAAMVLPSLVLGTAAAAVYFRLTRIAVEAELSRPYATAGLARGLSARRVLWRHAARTGLTPIIALAGLDLGLLLAGNVILVEQVFNLPGVGSLLVSSINHSDLPVIEGLVLFAALIMVVANLTADLVFRWLDPRDDQK